MNRTEPRTTEEQIVAMWNRGESVRKIALSLESVEWTPSAIALLLRQLRWLGVPLRPPPPAPGEHELELAALKKRLDIARLTAIAIEAKVGA